jgi:hypothetical protein
MNTPERPKTPEEHHTELINAIDYELTHYGPQSLADIIQNLIDARFDSEDNRAEATKWRAVRRAYEQLVEQLPSGPMPEHIPYEEQP